MYFEYSTYGASIICLRSFRNTDLSNIIYKGTPDFCSVYVIYKGKVSSVKHAVRPAPVVHPLKNQNDGRVLDNNHKDGMKGLAR